MESGHFESKTHPNVMYSFEAFWRLPFMSLLDAPSGLQEADSHECICMQELKVLMQAATLALKEANNSQIGLSAAAEDIITEFHNLSAEQEGHLPNNMLQNGVVLTTTSSEALHLLDVVKRACGPASKDVLQLLTPLLASLMHGSIKVNT